MFIFLSACSLLVPLSMIILGYTWKDKLLKIGRGVRDIELLCQGWMMKHGDMHTGVGAG